MAGILARTEQVEEGEADHIGNGTHLKGGGCNCSSGHYVKQKRDWARFDSVGWWIFALVGSKETLEAEVYFAVAIVAWIRGPHCTGRLANTA